MLNPVLLITGTFNEKRIIGKIFENKKIYNRLIGGKKYSNQGLIIIILLYT